MGYPADILKIYEKAIEVDGLYPYAYGGGVGFKPSPPIGDVGPPGFDCGKFVSMLVHAGAPDELPIPLGTHELERWQQQGFGEYLAVRVFNGGHEGVIVDHCLLEFRQGFPAEHRYAMAHYTGGPHCGFVAEGDFDPSFYRARRKAAG